MPAQFPKSTVDRVGYWGCRNPASASLSCSHLRLLGSATQLWAYEEWCWPQHLTVCSLSELQAQKLSKLLSRWEHQNLILKNIYLILCVHVSDCVYVMGAHKLWPSGSHSSLTMCIRETGLCQSSLKANDFTCWTVNCVRTPESYFALFLILECSCNSDSFFIFALGTEFLLLNITPRLGRGVLASSSVVRWYTHLGHMVLYSC